VNVAFVVPCLNEQRSLDQVLADLKSLGRPIIVVDDGSTDDTAAVAARAGVTVVRHTVRLGKGHALRTGWDTANAMGFTGIVSVDGDGQHRFEDVAPVLESAERAPSSIVIGARLKGRETQPTARRRANAVADWAVSTAAGQDVSDTQSGLRYYPGRVLDLPGVPTDHFVFESAILVEASRQLGTRIHFVPIRARYEKERRASHFRPVRDIARITGYLSQALFRYAVRRRGAAPRREDHSAVRPHARSRLDPHEGHRR